MLDGAWQPVGLHLGLDLRDVVAEHDDVVSLAADVPDMIPQQRLSRRDYNRRRLFLPKHDNDRFKIPGAGEIPDGGNAHGFATPWLPVTTAGAIWSSTTAKT